MSLLWYAAVGGIILLLCFIGYAFIRIREEEKRK